MKYKLVEVLNKTEEDVEFGTCELCSYLGTHQYDILIFRDESGLEYEFEDGYWDWGDYTTRWYIDNYIKFANFIADREYEKDLSDETIDKMYHDYSKANLD